MEQQSSKSRLRMASFYIGVFLIVMLGPIGIVAKHQGDHTLKWVAFGCQCAIFLPLFIIYLLPDRIRRSRARHIELTLDANQKVVRRQASRGRQLPEG